jgi:branched-chain amino acid aminotransferase
VRAYKTPRGTEVFRLHDHTSRLFNSAKILRLELPFSAEVINDAHLEVLRANQLEEGYLRPMAFLGSEGMGLRAEGLSVNVMVAAWPWPSYMAPEAVEQGIRMQTSSYTLLTQVLTKRCCSTMKVMSPKAPARIFFSSRTESCIRLS